MKKILFFALVAIFSHSVSYAQSDRTESLVKSEKNGWEYEVRAGVNIGGATPMPMPAEIRKIKSYSPKFNGTVEGVVTYWFDGNNSPWGLSTGLKVEEKGMITEADVKSYSTEIIQGSQRVAGYYTGSVKTQYNSTLLTLPVMATIASTINGKCVQVCMQLIA